MAGEENIPRRPVFLPSQSYESYATFHHSSMSSLPHVLIIGGEYLISCHLS